MQEFLTNQYDVSILRWAEPTEDGEVYEVIHNGRVIRADNATLILSEVLARQFSGVAVRPRPRLAVDNAWGNFDVRVAA